MEVWDAYDENLNLIPNKKLVRGDMIPQGMFHLVCDIIVRHTDGDFLLMQRDTRKKHYGGLWEATAGGAALSGESPYQCAKRELFEETGISSDDLKEVGYVINREQATIYYEFLCTVNCDKNSVVLQEGETVAYKWVTENELKDMKKCNVITLRTHKFLVEFTIKK